LEKLNIAESIYRVGPKRAGAQKLKVTLGSDLAAEELIAASQLLRESDDDEVKSVFINKDMTPLEAQMAYEAREQKRKVQPPSARVRSIPT